MVEVSKNITDIFIDSIYCFSKADYPDSVIFQAKKCLLDYLGVTLSGVSMNKEKCRNLLESLGSAVNDATVIGLGSKTTILNAALINGINAHVAELDDGVRFGMLHPGAPVISALLSLAEYFKINGSYFIKGLITGYEAAIRLATAIQPSHKELGYHATATCGQVGAAIGAAVALQLTQSQMKDALSTAVTGASGLLKVFADGSELKPYNAGQAAQNGLAAALLARAGFSGPDDILGGEKGFIALKSEKHDLTHLKDAKSKYSIEKVYFKPYAACRHCHPAIEAALAIRTKYTVRPDEIETVDIKTYRWAVEGHDHTNIKGTTSAKMSIPFSVAVALKTGKADLDDFSAKAVEDADVLSLTQKVHVSADENLTLLVPDKRAAIVKIYTGNDDCYTERVDYPKGEPENPLSAEELTEKFITLAQYGGKPERMASEIRKIVWSLENNLHNLYDLL